jgi:NAD(P)-dependent dehydrogenase (short-subunit alcohol dehydrogenase family)
VLESARHRDAGELVAVDRPHHERPWPAGIAGADRDDAPAVLGATEHSALHGRPGGRDPLCDRAARRRVSGAAGRQHRYQRRRPRHATSLAPVLVGYTAMPDRAAIVTGASRGIGHAIASMLAEEGYALTLSARRPDSLDAAAQALRDAGHEVEVEAVPGNISAEEDVQRVVAAHNDRFGRLDVLVNSAGVGVGAAVADIQTKRVDLQLDVNLRALILFYREALELLRAAGAEHGNALVVNLASIAGKSGQPWLSVYSATKAAVIGWTQAMNKELNSEGIKSVALCPGFVDTDMTEFIREHVKPADMIRPEDIAESVRFLLRVSPACVVPEIVFQRPAESL